MLNGLMKITKNKPTLAFMVLFLISSLLSSIGLAEDETQKLFNQAQQELASGQLDLAAAHFSEVKLSSWGSKYDDLSGLALADIAYRQKKYDVATDGYRRFLKSQYEKEHPGDSEVARAEYQIGMSYYGQRVRGSVIEPPVYERDTSQIQKTMLALERFLQDYPSDSHAKSAREIVAKIRDTLAQHDLYVARFNEKHGLLRGALWRYRALCRDYPDSTYAKGVQVEMEKLLAELKKAGISPDP